MYYSNQKLLSYNKLFNFVVGNRGGGKSFNAKEWSIKDFIKNGNQFIYIRRYKTELEHIQTYFTDIAFKFPDNKLEVKGRNFYIDGKLAGYAIPLSTSQKEKSTSYPKVNKIIFDEFIIEQSVYHYIKNEVQLFLDFYETVARTRDVRVMFISNAITIVNPYFSYFNIYPRVGSKFTTGNEWVIEMYKNTEFVEMKKNTRFGKLIDGTQYGCYNIENEFLRDNDRFIESMSGNCIYWCGINYLDKIYGIWFSQNTGFLYVNQKYDKSRGNIYCFTTDDHRPNIIYLKSIKNMTIIKDIRQAYEMGLVRFDCVKTKQAFYDFMNLL